MPSKKHITKLAKEFFATIVGLLIIALTISSIYLFKSYIQGCITQPIAPFESPKLNNIFDWINLISKCICTGFIEERIFRVWLPHKLEKSGAEYAAACAFSAAFFGCFHIWEGAFGAFNALGAALYLSFCYKKYNSFAVIVLAHSVYNFLAYII